MGQVAVDGDHFHRIAAPAVAADEVLPDGVFAPENAAGRAGRDDGFVFRLEMLETAGEGLQAEYLGEIVRGPEGLLHDGGSGSLAGIICDLFGRSVAEGPFADVGREREKFLGLGTRQGPAISASGGPAAFDLVEAGGRWVAGVESHLLIHLHQDDHERGESHRQSQDVQQRGCLEAEQGVEKVAEGCFHSVVLKSSPGRGIGQADYSVLSDPAGLAVAAR